MHTWMLRHAVDAHAFPKSEKSRRFGTFRNCLAGIYRLKRVAETSRECAIQTNVKMSLEMAKSLFPRRVFPRSRPFHRSSVFLLFPTLAGSTYIRASLCPWRSWRLRMRATSSGGFGSARGILERCCRPWPFWPRGISNTTETEARAWLGVPLLISALANCSIILDSRWPIVQTRYQL